MEPLDLSTIGRCGAAAARQALLHPAAFFTGCDILFSHLRLKEADRWNEGIALVKLASFTEAFPEVNDRQFVWACEHWVQTATGTNATGGPQFRTVPPWAELMASLYRREGGLANRSWGFRPDLPAYLQPTEQQLQLLPARPQSRLGSTDPSHMRYLPPAELTRWTAADGSARSIEPGDPTPLLEQA